MDLILLSSANSTSTIVPRGIFLVAVIDFIISPFFTFPACKKMGITIYSFVFIEDE